MASEGVKPVASLDKAGYVFNVSVKVEEVRLYAQIVLRSNIPFLCVPLRICVVLRFLGFVFLVHTPKGNNTF